MCYNFACFEAREIRIIVEEAVFWGENDFFFQKSVNPKLKAQNMPVVPYRLVSVLLEHFPSAIDVRTKKKHWSHNYRNLQNWIHTNQ